MPRIGWEDRSSVTTLEMKNQTDISQRQKRLVSWNISSAKDGDKPLKFLLQSYPKLIEKEAHEWTSLHWACRQGNSQAAKILLEHGSQIKTVTTLQPPQSWSPYQILIHNREDLRSFDESTTYALGRLEKIGLGAGQSPGAQIEYGSLEIAETRGQSSCFLCGNSVHVCDDVLLLFFLQGYDC
jgi:ankyrin repeat protein